jgi:ankyrin repeat protein
VLDTLLKAGAKWTDSDLAVAAEGCYPQVIEAMLKSGANPNATRNGRPALLMTMFSDCGDGARLLMSAGADVNAKSSDGRTALMQAAGDGRAALVQLLLEKGADLEATDTAGRTAWMYAAMGNQIEVVEMFKKARARRP